MKRFFALLLACLALSLLFSSCTGGEKEDETPSVAIGGLDEDTQEYYTPSLPEGETVQEFGMGGVPLS